MASIAILGPGAIGCAVGAALLEAGHHQVFFCANSPFDRLHITLPGRFELDQPAEVHTTPTGLAPTDWLLLCVKAQQVPATEPWLRALVAPRTRVAMLQNGVEHLDPIAALIGDPTRILPVVVQIPAERTAPGAVTLNGTPHLVVPAGPLGESFQTLFADSPIPAHTTPDFTTRMWEKLCLNAVNGSITAITERDQSILRQPEIAELARQIVLECMAVGRAEGATLDDQLPTRIVAQLAGPPGARGGGNSMLYDRLAGRELEAEARNGVIPRLGAKHGIPTPINAAVYALLKNLTPRPTTSS
jgi:2-dehydropantoate 2-reductase